MAAEVWPERRGIEPVPVHARTTSPRQLFAIWFAPGLGLVPIGVGTIAAAQFIGLGWWDGLAAIVLGNGMAGAVVALLAVRGAGAGVPQMASARVPFGKAMLVPAVVNWASLIAWSAIYAVFGAQALVQLTGGAAPLWAGLLLIGGGQAMLAVLGFPAVSRYQRFAAVILTVLFVMITVTLSGKVDLGLGDGPTASPATFVLMIAVAGSLNLAWAATACDYSRYVAPTAEPHTVFAATFLGLVVPTVWLEALGLAVAQATLPGHDPVQAFVALLGGGVMGTIGMAAISLGTLAVNGMILYSASLSLMASGPRLYRPAVAAVTALASFGVAAALVLVEAQGWLENELLIVGYWIPAWAAVMFIDWRRHPALEVAAPRASFRALPAGRNALLALVLGAAAAVPFVDQALFVGPVANALGGADLGYVVSFVVAGMSFAVLEQVRPTPRSAVPIEVIPGAATAMSLRA